MLINNSNNSSTILTSFQAMKPNQFRGLDYATVRKFKAPVEKFNSNSDLQNWAGVMLQTLTDKTYKSNTCHVDIGRRISINKWKDFLLTKGLNWTETKKLITFSAMVQGLKENNDKIPPIINEDILNKTFTTLESDLIKDKDLCFNFNKLYKKELEKQLKKEIPENYTGWIVLPSKKHNQEDFINNTERLKLFSSPAWCIKNWHYAESYLERGDFHLYLEEGSPKLCIRFSANEIVEIQGEKNNSTIPTQHLDLLKMYIENGHYHMNEDTEFLLYQFGIL